MGRIGLSIKDFFKPIHKEDNSFIQDPNDSFLFVDEVEKMMTDKLQQVYGGRNNELKGQTLTLWITDDSQRQLISQCHDRILNNLHNNNGFPIEDVAFSGETIPQGATTISDGLAFTIGNNTIPSSQSGILRIHNSKGSMMQQEYELTALGGRYYIGRGAIGNNAIGIDANPNDSMYELNKYVRSHHAHIEYINALGFCMFVDKDGSQVFGGSRTQIQRLGAKEPLELNNPQQPVLLKDGDVIILGKSVELEWVCR